MTGRAEHLPEAPHPVKAIMHNDAGCPWGYSANPAFRVLEWRYGAQLDWRLVLIGLTEHAQQYVERGYTPLRSAEGYARRFRRFGMPFAPEPRARVVGTGRACRAVVAARLLAPGTEWEVFRAFQFAWFTTTLLLDDDDGIAQVLRGVPGIDAGAVLASLDSPEVDEAYQRDRAEARSAAGSPADLQEKTAATDGPVRFTAPSVIFELDGRSLVAGGWQTIEAYDVLVANLIPNGERRGVPDDPLELLERFPGGLTTQEVAQLLTCGNDASDRTEAEAAMLGLVASGAAVRTPIGDDALWAPAS
jgi:2-hydroxychromene-2-carboxylate isomerase